MSLAALLQAVRDELRQGLPMPDIQCEVQRTGQPPPGIGSETYISIHPLGWTTSTNAEVVMGIDESYAIGVTISKRVSGTPADRRMREMFLKSLFGFEHLARRIIILLHQRQSVIDRANTIILANNDTDMDVLGFIEYLRWVQTEESPTVHDETWFWDTTREGYPQSSESMTISFGEARRVQILEDMQ